MAIELPEFATGAIHEVEPTPAEKFSGWTLGDAAPSAYFNWLSRRTYEAIRHVRRYAFAKDWVNGPAVGSGSFNAIAADGNIIITAHSDNIKFKTSVNGTDGPFVEHYDEADTENIDALLAVPNAYAVAVRGTSFHSAAFPYDSWTAEVTSAFTATGPVSGEVTSIDSATRLALVRAGYLIYASASSQPTTAGHWTEVDLSSVIAELSGIATDGANNVICGSDGATTARVAYAPVSAGGLVGDWTPVDVGSTTQITDVIYNRSLGAFIAIDEAGQIYRSDDSGVTWSAVGTPIPEGTQDWRLVADPGSGVTLAYFDTGTGEIDVVYAARDGLYFVSTETDANLAYSGTLGRPRLANLVKSERFAGGTGLVSGSFYLRMTA